MSNDRPTLVDSKVESIQDLTSNDRYTLVDSI